MLNTQFSPWPSFTEEEANAVKNVLLSNRVNYWTGDKCKAFEKEFAEFANVKHAIAVSNGTTALELALKAIDIQPGDEVIIPPRTFLATASSVVTWGGVPVFADIELDSGNICPVSIAEKITDKTKAIIVVHLAGWPCKMKEIMALAKQYNLKVIEDCAQAHGAKYDGRSVGSIGDIGCWSFCQDKIMTTGGEGGMVTTNSESIWKKMWSFKDHGKDFDAVYNIEHPPGFRWLHNTFGTNYRMTEMQAVIGSIQLKLMSTWLLKRNENANALASTISLFDCVNVPSYPKEIAHAQYKFYVYVDDTRLKDGWTRDRIVDQINAYGVPCYQGSCSEVYLEKAFDNTKFRPTERLVNAKRIGEISLMFLVHPTLTRDEIEKTKSVIHEVFSEAQA